MSVSCCVLHQTKAFAAKQKAFVWNVVRTKEYRHDKAVIFLNLPILSLINNFLFFFFFNFDICTFRKEIKNTSFVRANFSFLNKLLHQEASWLDCHWRKTAISEMPETKNIIHLSGWDGYKARIQVIETPLLFIRGCIGLGHWRCCCHSS